MMGPLFSRFQLIGVIVCFYALPILVLTLFGSHFKDSWSLLNLGLAFLAIGSGLIFFLLIHWENNLLRRAQSLMGKREEEPHFDLPREGSSHEMMHFQGLYDQSQAALQDLESRQQESQDLVQKQTVEIEQLTRECERYKQEAEQLLADFQEFKEQVRKESDLQQSLLLDHQQTIAEQRLLTEKKQQQVIQLEAKVIDLNYELKTLLRLAEKPIEIPMERVSYPSQPAFTREEYKNNTQQSDEPVMQLKRCLEIAQNIMGATHFGGPSSRLRDVTSDHFALDQRRLFDRLGGESENTVFFYSPKDNKVLFVNDQVKQLLGITPEKFIQNFTDLMQVGMEEWKKGLNQLSYKNEAKALFPLKTRSGQEILVNCLLGIIAAGPFRQHVIGVMQRM